MIANHPDIVRYDISSIRQIMYGGSPTPLGVLRKAAETFAENVFLHTYGITETAGIACCLDPAEHSLEVPADGRLHRAAAAGHPVPFLDMRILDADGVPLPPGAIGEIAFRGPKVMKEYWNKPAETAAVLRKGWYLTGDMGRIDETGALYILDRKKDMIISGGENIYSVEVEDALSTHPGVLEVAVIGVPDPLWGEAIRAIVVPRSDAVVDEAALINHCRNLIGGYKVPKSIAFRTEPLPKTGPGKIAKRRLRDLYWQNQDRRI